MRWWPLLLLAGCLEESIPDRDELSTTGGGPGGVSNGPGDLDEHPEAEPADGDTDSPLEPDDDQVEGSDPDDPLTPVPVAEGELRPLANPHLRGTVRVVADGDVILAELRAAGQAAGATHRQALVSGSCAVLGAAEVVTGFEPFAIDHPGWFEWQGAALVPDPTLEGTAWVIYGADGEDGRWDPSVPAACADLVLP
jgi:hypothetical protein